MGSRFKHWASISEDWNPQRPEAAAPTGRGRPASGRHWRGGGGRGGAVGKAVGGGWQRVVSGSGGPPDAGLGTGAAHSHAARAPGGHACSAQPAPLSGGDHQKQQPGHSSHAQSSTRKRGRRCNGWTQGCLPALGVGGAGNAGPGTSPPHCSAASDERTSDSVGPSLGQTNTRRRQERRLLA